MGCSVDELETIQVFVLKLSPRKYQRNILNLNNAMLTDTKLEALAPLIANFHTVELGGRQEYTKDGFQKLCVSLNIYASRRKNSVLTKQSKHSDEIQDLKERETPSYDGSFTSKVMNVFKSSTQKPLSVDGNLTLKRLELKSNRQQNANTDPAQIETYR